MALQKCGGGVYYSTLVLYVQMQCIRAATPSIICYSCRNIFYAVETSTSEDKLHKLWNMQMTLH